MLTAFTALFGQKVSAQAAGASSISINQMEMPQLNRVRTFRVFLPAGYASSKKKYPVIYMHDGQNIFTGNTSFAGSWLVDSTINTFPAGKQCIVVGIDNGGKYRMGEYNAYASQYAQPEGDAYVAFIVNTLKPHIDRIYRTKTAARYTAIAGSSMGGLISMYAAVKYPKVFGVAGIFSPSFWIAKQIYPLVSHTGKVTKQRFYFACGDMESEKEVAEVLQMDSILVAKGYSRIQVPRPLVLKGAKHNEKQWRDEFPDFYRWLMR